LTAYLTSSWKPCSINLSASSRTNNRTDSELKALPSINCLMRPVQQNYPPNAIYYYNQTMANRRRECEFHDNSYCSSTLHHTISTTADIQSTVAYSSSTVKATMNNQLIFTRYSSINNFLLYITSKTNT
jgi:hypothetical protein